MSNKGTILAVDDTVVNIDVVKSALASTYLVQAATSGQLALEIVKQQVPDLILLDVVMPDMDGYEICRQLKENPATKDVPIIFLTSKSEIEDEAKGLMLGAVDYIIKPICKSILQARVGTQLELKRVKDDLQQQKELLEQKVMERTHQLEELQDVTMVALGNLAEVRDPETGNHIRRTQNYVQCLANALKDSPRFSTLLTPENIRSLYKSAPLHDIGKVGIPDHILLKPGKLTADEFELMKSHTTCGGDAIAAAEKRSSRANNFLRFAKEIAYYHHEKWDGTGYPLGLVGDDIPIAARLMAIADVYDALISRRVYKPPLSHEEAVAIISDGKGTHFDPEMVEAFLRINDQFHAIAKEYVDNEEALKRLEAVISG